MSLPAILAALGRRPDELTPLTGGVANEAYLLGPDLVLRVPRSEAFAADLRKEAAVLPLVCAAGVRTADLVGYADRPTQYLITSRLPGAEHPVSPKLARQVGHELAGLHRITDLPADLPHDEPADPHALLNHLSRSGWIGGEDAAWLGEWFARLETAVHPDVLVHGDVAPQNLLSTMDGELTGLIDWGDAALADPAIDFAKLPFGSVPAALEGYREAGAPDVPWEPRVLWHRLTWALARMENPRPQPGAGHWSAPPAARLIDTMRFFAAAPPPPWSSYAPPSGT